MDETGTQALNDYMPAGLYQLSKTKIGDTTHLCKYKSGSGQNRNVHFQLAPIVGGTGITQP